MLEGRPSDGFYTITTLTTHNILHSILWALEVNHGLYFQGEKEKILGFNHLKWLKNQM